MLQRARRHLAGTRRLLIRHRRALAALLAAGAVGAGLLVVAPPPPPSTDVVVASHDLRAGRSVTGHDLTTVAMPAELTPRGARSDPAGLVGRVLTGPVRSGEPITDVRVLGDPLLAGYGPGRVALPVRMGDAAAVSLLRAGDRIDVLAIDPATGGTAVVVAAAVPVITVPAIPEGAAEPAGGLVLLAVSDAAARRISTASVVGPLTFVLTR